MKNNKIFLTFDVEEFTFSVNNNFESKFKDTTKLPKKGCEKILNLLKEYQINSTFFFTANFADMEKRITKKVSDEGHEIACHGFLHQDLTKLNLGRIEKDLKKAKKMLENIAKTKVIGFRAPYLRINNNIFRILERLNFKYDSSLQYHFFHPYGKISPSIKEFPVSVFPFLRLPISWYWMRNLGLNWTNLATKILLKKKQNVILYFHTWEFVNISNFGKIPFYIKRKTGNCFLDQLEKFIHNFESSMFKTLRDYEKNEKYWI